MSKFGLIKATHGIQRSDTNADYFIVTKFRRKKKLDRILPKNQSLRELENAVALSIKGLDTSFLPKLVRGLSFYQSIINEITK